MQNQPKILTLEKFDTYILYYECTVTPYRQAQRQA